MPREPREDEYDVIVVGAGFGGLSSSAFLAKAGKKVLVVDRLDGPGGCAHIFKRGPYTFDPAIHVTAQAKEGQILDIALKVLGVRDRCNLLQIDHLYAANYPGRHFHAPIGIDNYIGHFAQLFPQEAAHFGQFIQLAAQITVESQQLPPQLNLQQLGAAVEQFPTLFKYRTATINDVLDECQITDQGARSVAATTWPYLGLPPSQLSFYTWAAMTMSVMEDGPVYCKGSFQVLADAFVTSLERSGGELVLDTCVDRILVQDGRTTGVMLEGGREIRTPVVISNADATKTFEQMVGPDHLPVAFMRRLHRMTPSLSAFVIYAATDLDLHQFSAAHETFLYLHWDHDETLNDVFNGRPGGMWVNVPSLLDPSLAPAGEHLIIFTSFALRNIGQPWEEERDRFTNLMLDHLNDLFPGVRDRLTYLETATPETLERYTQHHQGAIYGWGNTPAQAGTQRLGHTTPINGLYLSGHWTLPGTGSLRAIYSGLQTAQIVMGFSDLGQLFGAMDANRPA